MSIQFNNFKTIQTKLILGENDFIAVGRLFDDIHGRVLNNEVRNFNRGEYSKFYSNKDNCIKFKVPTSIILYWNHKPVFYFHKTNELIYIPKTLANKILNNYDTIHHENNSFISKFNIQHIYSWESKYLNDNCGQLNIVN